MLLKFKIFCKYFFSKGSGIKCMSWRHVRNSLYFIQGIRNKLCAVIIHSFLRYFEYCIIFYKLALSRSSSSLLDSSNKIFDKDFDSSVRQHHSELWLLSIVLFSKLCDFDKTLLQLIISDWFWQGSYLDIEKFEHL